jgi:drug/metabolite transporter (DMT)-like permease
VTTLSSLALVSLLSSSLIHPIWNMFTKRSIHKAVFLWFCQIPAIIVFLPFAIREITSVHHTHLFAWTLVLIAMCIHGTYVLLLAKTYTLGDLSQVYPVMRGTSPLLVPLVGVLFLGERLNSLGWGGVLCIVCGICLLSGWNVRTAFQRRKNAIFLALLVGVTISGYTLVDKLALREVPPILLNEASNVGNLLALTWTAIRSSGIRREWSANWKTILLGGVLAPGGYILFLTALQISAVSQIAPMREIGTVFGTLLGIFLLHESHGKRRIGGAMLVAGGVILLGFGV